MLIYNIPPASEGGNNLSKLKTVSIRTQDVIHRAFVFGSMCFKLR